jgi:hypothetical protein
MANYKVVDADKLDAKFTDIANAVREKTGKTDLISDENLANEILGISGDENKLRQVFDKTIKTLTADDLGNATSISPNIFQNCTELTSVELPDTITNIGAYAFDGCANVSVQNINYNVGAYAFARCKGGTFSFHPNAKDLSINNYAFQGVDFGDVLELPPNTKTTAYGFYGAKCKLNIIPEGTTGSVGGFASSGAEEIIWYPSMNATYQFNGFKTKKITTHQDAVPSACFWNTLSLKTLILVGDTVKPLENTNAFHNSPATIYIKPFSPDVDEMALVEEYKAATNWTTLASRIKPYSEYVKEE